MLLKNTIPIKFDIFHILQYEGPELSSAANLNKNFNV